VAVVVAAKMPTQTSSIQIIDLARLDMVVTAAEGVETDNILFT
jgi:hypothetical protein